MEVLDTAKLNVLPQYPQHVSQHTEDSHFLIDSAVVTHQSIVKLQNKNVRIVNAATLDTIL